MFHRHVLHFANPARFSKMDMRFFSKRNFKGNANAWPCEMMKMSCRPVKEMLSHLPIKSNTVFVRSPEGLDFCNTLHQKIHSIRASEAILESFDQAMNPTTESRTISEAELDKIKSITGFCLPVHYYTAEETKILLDGIERAYNWAEHERNSPGSTMGPY